MKTSLIMLVAGVSLNLSIMANVQAVEQTFTMPVTSGLTDLKLVEVVPGSSWAEKDGVIISKGEGESYLVTQADYGDFMLEMDFKPSDEINAGVYMRCADISKIKANTCYEANIWDKSKKTQFRTGGIVDRQAVINVQDTINQWNHYKLTLRGDTIEVELNGKVTGILKDSQLKKGFIGFQHKGSGSIELKNIQLTPLKLGMATE
ncbi:3-keto-disaccharide hydrolase [Shewanella baltica]|uniref:3-keto-disaccharide hydrolase n=1 Tax=Shewanella baltica TaxID=62322 RepID=UPI003CFFC89A